MTSFKETIVAIATPQGEGAIGIVRLSGQGSFRVAARIFHTRKGGGPEGMSPFRLTLGCAMDPASGEPIDEVLGVIMPGPTSYTGEDMVELQAHGGRAVLEKIVEAALGSGARTAEPGEFTKRAFLNGRLDLAQAEAVISLIRSRSDLARKAALGQLKGSVSRAIGDLRSTLMDISVSIEALLDFSEDEDIREELSPMAFDESLRILTRLLENTRGAGIVKEGIHVTFVGRPNTGKSSIINMLLNEERSIVTPYPGTTRDPIESSLFLDGAEILLVDTAGLGTARDPVEEEGIRRSLGRLDRTDFAVIVLDGSRQLDESDRILLQDTADKPSVIVLNKIDLDILTDEEEIAGLAQDRRVVRTSAKSGAGIESLRQLLRRSLDPILGASSEENPLITSLRHQDALRRSLHSLERGKRNLAAGNTLDMIATDVREALSALGEITGDTVTDDILDSIFRHFCIGK